MHFLLQDDTGHSCRTISSRSLGARTAILEFGISVAKIPNALQAGQGLWLQIKVSMANFVGC